MATKHLSNFYSYKFIPQQLRFLPPVIDAEEALEKQVQAHLANGHRYFFRDEFQSALAEYQTAFSLLHKFLHPNFPTHVTAQVSTVLQGLELTGPMIAASAQVARTCGGQGSR